MIPGFLEKHRLAAAGGCGGGGNGQLPAGLDVGREKTGGKGHAQACGPSRRTGPRRQAAGGAGWGLGAPGADECRGPWGRGSRPEGQGGRGRVGPGSSRRCDKRQDFTRGAAGAKLGRACSAGFLEGSLGCGGGVDYGGWRTGGREGAEGDGPTVRGQVLVAWTRGAAAGRLGVSWLGGWRGAELVEGHALCEVLKGTPHTCCLPRHCPQRQPRGQGCSLNS